MFSIAFAENTRLFTQAYTCQGIPLEVQTTTETNDLPFLTLAANASDFLNFYVDAEYHFFVTMISVMTRIPSSNIWRYNQHNINYELFDTTSRRNFQNVRVASSGTAGTGQRPMPLAFPLLYNSTEEIKIQVTNDDILTLDVMIKLRGIKVLVNSHQELLDQFEQR